MKPRACIDTTIFIEYLVFDRDYISIYTDKYRLYTTSSVLWETTYILLKARTMKDKGIKKHYVILDYLRKNPDYVKLLLKRSIMI